MTLSKLVLVTSEKGVSMQSLVGNDALAVWHFFQNTSEEYSRVFFTTISLHF